MEIIAHRGNSAVAPENTMAAFEAAVRSGADCIETDIHLCASGEIVIIHDDDVAATSNGSGRVSILTLAELKSLDFGSWFSPAYAGQRIPTLDELVGFYLANPKLRLLLEFKGDWSAEAVDKAITILDAAGLRPRTILESFSEATMAALAEVAPHYQRGLLVEDETVTSGGVPAGPDSVVERPTAAGEGGDGEPLSAASEAFEPQRDIEKASALGASYLNPSVALVRAHPDLVEKCHAAGLLVQVWTADSVADFTLLASAGVEGICTNRPEFLAGWLAGQPEPL